MKRKREAAPVAPSEASDRSPTPEAGEDKFQYSLRD